MFGDSRFVGAVVSRSSEGVDPQERTRMLAEQRREREFEVCVHGAGGEHQNVCYGERYATADEARLALSVLVDDGAVDEAAAYVHEVQS
jgi:tellurite resistance protein